MSELMYYLHLSILELFLATRVMHVEGFGDVEHGDEEHGAAANEQKPQTLKPLTLVTLCAVLL